MEIRALRLIISGLSIFLSLIYAYIYYNYNRNTKLLITFDDEFVVNTPGCKIQNINPYHWSLRSYFRKYEEMYIKCKSDPMIIATNRKLEINKKYLEDINNVICQFQSIFRISDDAFYLNDPQIIDPIYGSVVNSEFVMVECFNSSNIRIYQDFFAFILRKPEVEKKIANISKKRYKKKSVNVLLVGLDAVPKTAYTRHLKLVDKFFREKLTVIDLHGYNKLGYNTYPNMIPLNTGKLEEEFLFNQKTNYLNILPMVWSVFARNGFRTLYGEDYANGATFNYLRRGFGEQPTDYYLRAFSKAVEKSDMKKKLVNGCYHNRTEASVIFKWVLDFFNEFPNDPLFAYVFLSNLSHDDYNGVALYDMDVLHLFESLHKSGSLDRTIVFLFSDHGYRFNGISSTYIGYLEEKLPLFLIILPSWFPILYPKYYANMEINQRRLVTALDIHSTLVDIATDFYRIKPVDPLSRSISLFKPIPETRDCKIANIKSQYCICSQRQNVSVENKLAEIGAHKLLDLINEITLPLRNVCATLEMKEIMQVKERVYDIENEASKFTDYMITFQTLPSNGIFQGTVFYNKENKVFNVERSIERINRYDNQSACVTDSHLRLYCYCTISVIS